MCVCVCECLCLHHWQSWHCCCCCCCCRRSKLTPALTLVVRRPERILMELSCCCCCRRRRAFLWRRRCDALRTQIAAQTAALACPTSSPLLAQHQQHHQHARSLSKCIIRYVSECVCVCVRVRLALAKLTRAQPKANDSHSLALTENGSFLANKAHTH